MFANFWAKLDLSKNPGAKTKTVVLVSCYLSSNSIGVSVHQGLWVWLGSRFFNHWGLIVMQSQLVGRLALRSITSLPETSNYEEEDGTLPFFFMWTLRGLKRFVFPELLFINTIAHWHFLNIIVVFNCRLKRAAQLRQTKKYSVSFAKQSDQRCMNCKLAHWLTITVIWCLFAGIVLLHPKF